jgi:hypothetical protein
VLLKQRSIRSKLWSSSGASEAALNTINNCRSDNREAPYLVLATNLSSTVFAASSEFQTQRSPKRESSKRVSYAIWSETYCLNRRLLQPKSFLPSLAHLRIMDRNTRP